jgi:hypothetical protein
MRLRIVYSQEYLTDNARSWHLLCVYLAEHAIGVT